MCRSWTASGLYGLGTRYDISDPHECCGSANLTSQTAKGKKKKASKGKASANAQATFAATTGGVAPATANIATGAETQIGNQSGNVQQRYVGPRVEEVGTDEE